jgi:hypothetical protein
MTRMLSCSIIFVFVYVQYFIRMSVSVYGFELFHIRTATTCTGSNHYYRGCAWNDRFTAYLQNQVMSVENMYSDLLPNPNPTFQAIDVVTACMDTFVQNQYDTKIGLDVCYAFSNDRCRAAIGSNINEFYQYATNPTFAYLTSCISYSIISTGPIINGTAHRGSMQTVLMEVIPSIITTSMTTTIPKTRKLLSSTININDDMSSLAQKVPATSSTGRRFLWTLQQERRPPLQNCWMIHEVLYTKNAFQQTM